MRRRSPSLDTGIDPEWTPPGDGPPSSNATDHSNHFEKWGNKTFLSLSWDNKELLLSLPRCVTDWWRSELPLLLPAASKKSNIYTRDMDFCARLTPVQQGPDWGPRRYLIHRKCISKSLLQESILLWANHASLFQRPYDLYSMIFYKSLSLLNKATLFQYFCFLTITNEINIYWYIQSEGLNITYMSKI